MADLDPGMFDWNQYISQGLANPARFGVKLAHGADVEGYPTDPRIADLYTRTANIQPFALASPQDIISMLWEPQKMWGTQPGSFGNNMLSNLGYFASQIPGYRQAGEQYIAQPSWFPGVEQGVRAGLLGQGNAPSQVFGTQPESTASQIIGALSGYLGPQGGMFPGFLQEGRQQIAGAGAGQNTIDQMIGAISGYMTPEYGMFPGYFQGARNLMQQPAQMVGPITDQAMNWLYGMGPTGTALTDQARSMLLGAGTGAQGSNQMLGQLAGNVMGAQPTGLEGLIGKAGTAGQAFAPYGEMAKTAFTGAGAQIPGVQTSTSRMFNALAEAQQPQIWGKAQQGIENMISGAGQPTPVDTGAIYNAMAFPFEDQMRNLREAFGTQGLRYSSPLLFEEGRQRERFAADVGSQLAQMNLQAQEAGRGRQMQALGLGQALGESQAGFPRQNLLAAMQPLQFGAQYPLEAGLAQGGAFQGLGQQYAQLPLQEAQTQFPMQQFGATFPFQQAQAGLPLAQTMFGQPAATAEQLMQMAQFQTGLPERMAGAALPWRQQEIAIPFQQAQTLYPYTQQQIQGLQGFLGAATPLAQAQAQIPLQQAQALQGFQGQQIGGLGQFINAAYPWAQGQAQIPMQAAGAALPWAQTAMGLPLQQAAALQPFQQQEIGGMNQYAQTMLPFAQQMGQFPFQQLQNLLPYEQQISGTQLQRANQAYPMAQYLSQYPIQLAQQAQQLASIEDQLRLQDMNAVYQDWQRTQPYSSPVMQAMLQYAMGIPGATQSPVTPWGEIIGAAAKVVKAFSRCFAKGTEVVVSYGDTLDWKAFEDIEPGDKVPVANGKVDVVTRLLSYENEVPEYKLNGILMKDHPIYLQNGEIRMVSWIENGTALFGENAASLDADIEKLQDQEPTTVYNLELKNGHQFYVVSDDGPILVHNGREF